MTKTDDSTKRIEFLEAQVRSLQIANEELIQDNAYMRVIMGDIYKETRNAEYEDDWITLNGFIDRIQELAGQFKEEEE